MAKKRHRLKREETKRSRIFTAVIWVVLILAIVLIGFVVRSYMARVEQEAKEAKAETYDTLAERATKESEKETAVENYNIAGGSAVKDFGVGDTFIQYGDTSISINYPVTEISSVNEAIMAEVENIKKDFQTFLTEQEAKSGSVAELNTDYETYMANDKLGSVYFETDMYLEGAAKSQHKISVLNFDFETGEVITPKDMIKNGGLEKLAELSKKIITDNIDTIKAKDIDDTGLYAENENFSNLLLTYNGLKVLFNEYQIVSGTHGVVEVNIPYNEIEDYLDIDQKGLAKGAVSPTDKEYSGEDIAKKDEAKEDTTAPMVALTFSDGPSDDYTNAILDTLKKNDAVGTFFVTGNRILHREWLLKRMEALGCEVGNHSMTHRNLENVSKSVALKEIKTTNTLIEKALKHTATVIEMPYFAEDCDATAEMESPVIDRSLDVEDWDGKTADEITSKVLEGAKDGTIIALHDTEKNTAGALDGILKGLKAKGFRIVTVTELLTSNGEELTPGQVYSSK